MHAFLLGDYTYLLQNTEIQFTSTFPKILEMCFVAYLFANILKISACALFGLCIVPKLVFPILEEKHLIIIHCILQSKSSKGGGEDVILNCISDTKSTARLAFDAVEHKILLPK